MAAAVAAAHCMATAAAQQSGQAPPLSIAHVAIRVGDLSAARAFYSSLGYEEAFALDKGGAPTEAFFKVNNRQFIELYPPRRAGETIGFLHVCFESKDLNAQHDAYIARGLDPTAVKKAGAGNLLFTMRGPENQNIEYTQYMPGSKHSLDIGKHLGPDRIADRLAGVGIPMENVAAADAFYKAKLNFAPLRRGFDRGANAFRLPGSSAEEIEILPQARNSRFHLLLGVADIGAAAQQLSSRGIAYRRERKSLVLHDPDGNVIVLVLAPEQNGLHP